MEENRKRSCVCTAWKQSPGPSGYCPDIRRCLYVQTRLRIRNLQQQRYRRFDLLLPMTRDLRVHDTKESKDKLDGSTKSVVYLQPVENIFDLKTEIEEEDTEKEDINFQKGIQLMDATSLDSPFYFELKEKGEKGEKGEQVVVGGKGEKEKQEKEQHVNVKQVKQDQEPSGTPTSVSFWIEQSPSDLNLGEDGTGSVVWGPGVLMLDFLSGMCRAAGSLLLENKRVVELGAGTGVCSIVATLCGSSLLLATDRFASLTKKNLERLGLSPSPITIAEHTWGENLPQLGNYLTALFSNLPSTSTTSPSVSSSSPPIDIILLADVLYFSTYYQELITSINYIAEFGARTKRSGNFLASIDSQPDTKEICDDLFFYHQKLASSSLTRQTRASPSPAHPPPSSSSSSSGSSLYPFIILAHKRRNVETEKEFFLTISQNFRIFQVRNFSPGSHSGESSNSSSFNHWRSHRYRYLDGQDPNLVLLILIHRKSFIKKQFLHNNHKKGGREEDEDPPLVLKRTKSLDHPRTQMSKKIDSKLTKNRKSDILRNRRVTNKSEPIKDDDSLDDHISTEELFREHWFFKHIRQNLAEYDFTTSDI